MPNPHEPTHAAPSTLPLYIVVWSAYMRSKSTGPRLSGFIQVIIIIIKSTTGCFSNVRQRTAHDYALRCICGSLYEGMAMATVSVLMLSDHGVERGGASYSFSLGYDCMCVKKEVSSPAPHLIYVRLPTVADRMYPLVVRDSHSACDE